MLTLPSLPKHRCDNGQGSQHGCLRSKFLLLPTVRQHHWLPSRSIGRIRRLNFLFVSRVEHGSQCSDRLPIFYATIIHDTVMRSAHNLHSRHGLSGYSNQNYDSFIQGVAYPGPVKESISWEFFCLHSGAGSCPLFSMHCCF